MTHHYLAVRAYGDCLISLCLLQGVSETAHVRILGTPATTRIAGLLGLRRFPITEILPEVAAFYDIRVRGPRHALRDLLVVRTRLGALLGPDDTLILEHRDWRSRWLLPTGHGRYCEPPRGRSIYADRHALLSSLFGALPALQPSRPIPHEAARWVLNPGARQPFKALPGAVVESVLAAAAARGARITLLDPAREHAAVAARADEYVPGPTLERAVELLRGADAYIGPDSLFLHLAYFLRVPLFGIPPTPAPYFAPPGMLQSGSFLPIADARDSARLIAALDTAAG